LRCRGRLGRRDSCGGKGLGRRNRLDNAWLYANTRSQNEGHDGQAHEESNSTGRAATRSGMI